MTHVHRGATLNAETTFEGVKGLLAFCLVDAAANQISRRAKATYDGRFISDMERIRSNPFTSPSNLYLDFQNSKIWNEKEYLEIQSILK